MSIDVTLGAISHSLTWFRIEVAGAREATHSELSARGCTAERKSGKGWRLVKIDNFMKYAILPFSFRRFRGT